MISFKRYLFQTRANVNNLIYVESEPWTKTLTDFSKRFRKLKVKLATSYRATQTSITELYLEEESDEETDSLLSCEDKHP